MSISLRKFASRLIAATLAVSAMASVSAAALEQPVAVLSSNLNSSVGTVLTSDEINTAEQALAKADAKAKAEAEAKAKAEAEAKAEAAKEADLIMILTPDETVPEDAIKLMVQLVTFMGCADIVYSNPDAHDERIAYTSQLMHVMALALCDQHLLFDSFGFEGGSFRGATRVAALDPKLWTELFWANKETLADLTDELIGKLHEYSALLRGDDREALLARLTASSDRKKAFDRLRSDAPSQTPLFK